MNKKASLKLKDPDYVCAGYVHGWRGRMNYPDRGNGVSIGNYLSARVAVN